MCDVAARLGITERAVQRIVAEFEKARYLERERKGRYNRYHVRAERSLRYPVEAHRTFAAIIALAPPDAAQRPARRSARSRS